MDKQQPWIAKYTDFIKSGQYMNQPIEFYHDQKHTKTLIKYIEQLTPSIQNFQIAKNLMKFYRMSVFICFRNLYDRLSASPTALKAQCEQQVKYIASYVQETIKGLTIPELQFFLAYGLSKKRLKLAEKAEEQIKFMKYIDALSKAFVKFKSICKKGTLAEKKKCLNEFEGMSAEMELKFIEKNFQRIIKSQAIPYIEEIQKLEEEQEISSKEYLKEVINVPLSQIPLCCRTFFKSQEIIEQPQSLTIQYKFYTYPYDDRKNETIKKTMCGLLNGEGGTIYFGIKEDKSTKKRMVVGHFLDEKKKIEYTTTILQLFKMILPDQGKNCQIVYVPIKNKNGDDYISGKYIIKVIIKYGARDRVYSFLHQQTERFTIKTENEVLQIREPQKILKLQRDRLLKTQPPPKPLHKHPCPKPQKGKLIYEIMPFTDKKQDQGQQFQFPQTQQKAYKSAKEKPRFVEKTCLDYLLPIGKQQFLKEFLESQVSKTVSALITQSSDKFALLHVKKQEEINRIKSVFPDLQVLNVYNRVRVEGDEKTLDQIYDSLQQTFNIIRNKGDNFFVLKTCADAVKLYLKLEQMGIPSKFEAVSG